jgi:tetratricopeptide (TPR) repeat protein
MESIGKTVASFLWEKGYWPLAAPFVLIPAWLYSVKEYYDIKKLQTAVHHPIFWKVSIAIVAVAVFLQIVVWIFNPAPSLPKDRLVVLVTHFNEVGADAKETGATIAQLIEEALKAKAKGGAPLDVRPLNGKIEPKPGETPEAAARRIGKEPHTLAHLVLFGDIRKEDGELYIKPSIAVIEKFGDAEITGREMEAGKTRQGLGEPDFLTLKETKAKETADMVTLVTGLSFFQTKEFSKALEFLNTVQNAEAAFYRGIIFYIVAESSSDPVPLYKKATDEYNKSLESWKQETWPQEWAMIQNNLGNVYSYLGGRLGGAEGIEYLKKGVTAFNEALKERKRETWPQDWAMTQNNLGTALSSLGERMGGAEGIEYLEKAVTAFNEALKEFKRETWPQDWAITQNNLGNVLSILGGRMGGAEGIEYLKKGVTAFNEALKEHKRETWPQEWAMTQNNLGGALSSLGERMGGAEGIEYLKKGVTAFNEAMKEHKRETWPQEWALTQNNLGKAYISLGERAGGAEGIEYLEKAVTALNEALKEHKRETWPQDWAITQNNLGTALSSLGKRMGGKEGLEYLRKGVAAYDAALEILTEATPYYHERIKQNRQKALDLIAKLEAELGAKLHLPLEGGGRGGGEVNEHN